MVYSKLFSKGKIGSLELKNRLVMPPMVRNYADRNGLVTERYIDHIESIAKGGVGMMILEASFIAPEGKGFVNELGIHSDIVLPGLKRLVAIAHAQGAMIGPQLYHAGRQTSQKVTGAQPVGPSAIPDPSSGEMPRALSVSEIKRLVALFAQAATRAKTAGCDFVEIHGAHGYIITQFLSPFSNQRTDEYGGTLENRFRFMAEVFEAVRRAVGKDFPIIVRLSADEMVPKGLTLKDCILIAERLEKLGANALHISVGNYASYAQGRMIPPMSVDDGPLIKFAHGIKKSVKIPVIAVAKIRTPEMAEKIILKRQADFVAIGRALLADPQWPKKTQAGKCEDINPCIACNQGCISRLFAQEDVWCTVNPQTGREGMFKKPVAKKKMVVVVGGGPAGLSAAKVAAQRGHQVVLYEKEKRLGGQLFAAEAAPFRSGWKLLRESLVRDIKRLDIKVNLKTEYNFSLAKKYHPDAIILALGSSAMLPNIPGVNHKNVIVARDILEGKKKAKGKVVIAGGGCAGAQTAEYLAMLGHSVTIVEITTNIALDAPVDERALLLGRLKKLKVKLETDTKLMTIDTKTVHIEGPTGSKILSVDTVVLCLGSRSNDGLANELKQLVNNIIVVGDAVSPRRVTDAIAEGALAALAL